MIDSLNGYRHAMPEERFLVLHLHELLSYLGQQGVLTLLIMAQAGFLGEALESPVDLSYLADTVLLLRYFEAFGEVRKAISLVKRAHGAPRDHRARAAHRRRRAAGRPRDQGVPGGAHRTCSSILAEPSR